MLQNNEIIKNAKATILTEANAIIDLSSNLDENFISTINKIINSTGRVVVTGIGKSANIAQKIVATLNSTGTPSVFMHAADAIHGDLGIIQKEDIVICISKSGNTPEIKVLVPLIKNFKNTIVGITGNMDSYLAKNADFVLNTFVKKEACPNNLAPTSSTTAQMVMGDALAVCLLKKRGFNSADFAKFHPGGALGKKLYLRVADIYLNNAKPKVTPNSPIKEVIIEISSKLLGITAVVEKNNLVGIITDGDLRRMLEKNQDFRTILARDVMTTHPKTIEENELAVNALTLMQNNNITQLVVVKKNQYLGIIHLHDLLKEGLI